MFKKPIAAGRANFDLSTRAQTPQGIASSIEDSFGQYLSCLNRWPLGSNRSWTASTVPRAIFVSRLCVFRFLALSFSWFGAIRLRRRDALLVEILPLLLKHFMLAAVQRHLQ